MGNVGLSHRLLSVHFCQCPDVSIFAKKDGRDAQNFIPVGSRSSENKPMGSMMEAQKQTSTESIIGFRFRTRMSHPTFWLLSRVLLVFLPLCSCRDKITLDSPILDRPDDALVSEGKRFQLGFFTPDGSPDPQRRYVGVWDYGSEPKSVVWVANREPVLDGSGIFRIAEDGNLVVSCKGNASLWTTFLERPANFNRTVRLMDTGNLMVIEEDSRNGMSSVLWQSFIDGTTDTFLPGMLMGSEFKLTSWRGPGDPAEGNFTLEQNKEGDNQYVIKNPVYPYWQSGTYQDNTTSNDMPHAIMDLLSNTTNGSASKSDNTAKNPNFGPISEYIPWPRDFKNTRVKISFGGELQYFTRDSQTAPFSLKWSEPRDYCSRFNPCGNFGSCNNGSMVPCKCLPGFEPILGGCRRNSLSYDNDQFLSLKMMRAGKPDDDRNEAKEDVDCMNLCIQIAKCQAYSFVPNKIRLLRGRGGGKCWMWYEDLKDIQEDIDKGLDLNIRIRLADIGSFTLHSIGHFSCLLSVT